LVLPRGALKVKSPGPEQDMRRDALLLLSTFTLVALHQKIRRCNAGKPWTLMKGQVVPKVETTNLVGDTVAEAIKDVAEKSTKEALLNIILRNSSQDFIR